MFIYFDSVTVRQTESQRNKKMEKDLALHHTLIVKKG